MVIFGLVFFYLFGQMVRLFCLLVFIYSAFWFKPSDPASSKQLKLKKKKLIKNNHETRQKFRLNLCSSYCFTIQIKNIKSILKFCGNLQFQGFLTFFIWVPPAYPENFCTPPSYNPMQYFAHPGTFRVPKVEKPCPIIFMLQYCNL